MPNFFIVGAAKSGTTSLWMYLKQHPEIFMPESTAYKEPSYFCHNYGYANYDQYLKLFKDAANSKAIGEASTTYLTSSESASWIYRELPQAKIIIILRNPADRAYSLYRWMINHGYEDIYPFEKALQEELFRKTDPAFNKNNPQYFYNYMYYESGLYYEQLLRYYQEFPIEQIKVILLDDLKQQPFEIMKKIYTFLNVDNNFVPTIKVHNKAELRPPFIKIYSNLHKLKYRQSSPLIRNTCDQLLEKYMKVGNLIWPEMKIETRKTLIKDYMADIKKTEHLINRSLDKWLIL